MTYFFKNHQNHLIEIILIFFYNFKETNFSLEDAMSTLAELTIQAIFNSLKFLPKEIKTVFYIRWWLS